jgi:hypothetical protein
LRDSQSRPSPFQSKASDAPRNKSLAERLKGLRRLSI